MPHHTVTSAIRQQVIQGFVEFGAAQSDELRETILVRDGNYCGRRFESDAGTAIWFFEEGQVKVYRADGTLAQVLEAKSPAESFRKMAA